MDWSGEIAPMTSAQPGVQVELVHYNAEKPVPSEGSTTSLQALPESAIEQPVQHARRVSRSVPASKTPPRVEPKPEVAQAEPEMPVRDGSPALERLADNELHLGTRLTKLLANSVPPGAGKVQPMSYQTENGRKMMTSQSQKQGSSPRAAVKAWIEAQPRYRTNPLPEYPYQARVRQWRGQVLLMVTVDANGRVEDLEIERSSGHTVLDRAARQAVRRWEFMPALSAGVPVASRVMVPVHFELDRS